MDFKTEFAKVVGRGLSMDPGHRFMARLDDGFDQVTPKKPGGPRHQYPCHKFALMFKLY